MLVQNKKIERTFVLSFFQKFIIAVIFLQLSVFFLQSNLYFSVLIQSAITNTVGLIYNMVSSPVTIDGNLLIPSNSLNYLVVDNSCTGLMLIASVCAALIAFNYSWRVKVKMIMIAIVILQSENIVRIVHLLHVIQQDDNDFDFFHLYVWQVINFFTALIVIVSLEHFFKGSRYK